MASAKIKPSMISGRKQWNKAEPFLTLPRSLKIKYLFFIDSTYKEWRYSLYMI